MSEFTKQEVIDGFNRALDWLEANPDKHIRSSLATDDLGQQHTTSSENATCFCALGRFAREMRINAQYITEAALPLLENDIIDTEETVWGINDDLIIENRKNEVVPALRKLTENI